MEQYHIVPVEVTVISMNQCDARALNILLSQRLSQI